MFGLARRKATRTATEAVFPFIRVFEAIGGLPKGFWADPYVLGILSGTISIFAKLSTNGRVSGNELGRVLLDVFTTISGRDAHPIIRAIIDNQKSANPDFLLGVANADKMISFTYGLRALDNDPDILQAKRRAEEITAFSISNLDSKAAIDGALQQILFYEMVSDRLTSASKD